MGNTSTFLNGLALLVLLLMTSCVQDTKEQIVNFEVDMRGNTNVEIVGVRGSIPPLSWNQDLELKDSNGDSIFTGSVTLHLPYDFVELKFVKNGNQFELDNQPNRRVVFDKDQQTDYKAIFDQLD